MLAALVSLFEKLVFFYRKRTKRTTFTSTVTAIDEKNIQSASSTYNSHLQ